MRKTRDDDFATKKKKKNTFVSFIFAKSPLSFFLSFFLSSFFFLSFFLSLARASDDVCLVCVRVCVTASD